MLSATAAMVLASNPSSQFLRPMKMTFTSADPDGAAAFSEKYLGALFHKQPHNLGNGSCAAVNWVQFPGLQHYQWHFVKGFHRPNGTMTVDDFENRMNKLHGNLSHATYDEFEDFHVTMETADLDAFASKFAADGIPFLTRQNDGQEPSFSIFFELPISIVVELTGPSLSVVTPQPWARCGAPSRPAKIDLSAAKQRAAVKGVMPRLIPKRAVYASSVPNEAAAFVSSYLAGTVVAASPPPPAASGQHSCYTTSKVRWEASPVDDTAEQISYELLWIHAPKLRRGTFTVRDYEKYLVKLHGNLTTAPYDEYMDNHVGIVFNDSDEVLARIQQDKVPFFTRGQYGHGYDIFVAGPAGQIYEVNALHSTYESYPGWNLCGPL